MTSQLLENISRDMARWNAIGYCIVSASLDDDQRAEFKNKDGNGEQNWQRTSRMKDILNRSPFAFKKVWGEYKHNSEESYIIWPVSKGASEYGPNGGQNVGFDKLESFAKSLGKCFQQETILVRKPDDQGGDTYYINASNGEKDMEFDRLSLDVNPDEDFSTNTRNPKKLSHANHYFKYENEFNDSYRVREGHLSVDEYQDYEDDEDNEFFAEYERSEEARRRLKDDVQVSENYFVVEKTSDHYDFSKMEVMEIETLDDLKALSEENGGKRVIVNFNDREFGRTIEIYDDYRE